MRKSIHTPEYRVFLRRLREARERSGLSQGDVARAIGESQSFVSKLERGERRLDIIETRTLCGALGQRFPRFVAALEAELASVRS